MTVTYGNSHRGDVESEEVDGFGITYNLIRDANDHTLAYYAEDLGLWVRADGTHWTDIDVSP